MPDGNFDGVYIDAKALELSEEADIMVGIKSFDSTRPQPSHFATKSAHNVTGSAAWRMYKAIPIELSKRADSTSNGQAITIREIVQLQSLILFLA